MGELAPTVIGDLHGAYLRLPQQRREILLGLMNAYSSAMWTTRRLGGRGLPTLRPAASSTAPRRWVTRYGWDMPPGCEVTPPASSTEPPSTAAR